jgi:hypothetical protein
MNQALSNSHKQHSNNLGITYVILTYIQGQQKISASQVKYLEYKWQLYHAAYSQEQNQEKGYMKLITRIDFLFRSSTVSIANYYGLVNQGVGVCISIGSGIFTCPYYPGRLWGLCSLLSIGYGGLFRQDKAAKAWSWQLTSIQCQGHENMDLYIQFSIHLHGVLFS